MAASAVAYSVAASSSAVPARDAAQRAATSSARWCTGVRLVSQCNLRVPTWVKSYAVGASVRH